MALPINIDDLINRRVVESARVEYKKNWNAEPIVHSICAFANDIDNWGGGYLIVGVEEEDGMPKFPVEGIRKEKRSTESIKNCCKNAISLNRVIFPSLNTLRMKEKTF